ncbi:hypothetical protein [Actinophytocola sp.]|nr:hypothetical protein [Actinophytocola sp.]
MSQPRTEIALTISSARSRFGLEVPDHVGDVVRVEDIEPRVVDVEAT